MSYLAADGARLLAHAAVGDHVAFLPAAHAQRRAGRRRQLLAANAFDVADVVAEAAGPG